MSVVWLGSGTDMGTLCPAFGSPTFDSAPLDATTPSRDPYIRAESGNVELLFSSSEPRHRDTRSAGDFKLLQFFLKCGTIHVRSHPSRRGGLPDESGTGVRPADSGLGLAITRSPLPTLDPSSECVLVEGSELRRLASAGQALSQNIPIFTFRSWCNRKCYLREGPETDHFENPAT